MAEIGSSEAPLDASTSSAPTAAGPLVPLRTYDVFLNHRGPDVKKGFVSHLVASLAAVGVRTFVDYEELYVGDQAWDAIESAIRNSKVHIAIFSHGYADSPWCLRELCEMLECRTTGCSQLFLPVFFNVEPSDLRYPSSPKSCYSKAFDKLRTRNKPEVIEEWIRALSQASMEIGRTFDSQGFEADLVKLVVSDVLQVLNPTALSIATHPVGVDEKLQEALDLMEIHKVQQGLHILGIYGMGGVGKTTLAKSIYNKIHTNFDGFCFIESVRTQAETPHGLQGVQERILHTLLKSKATINISSTSHGKQLMINRFSGLKILIILDDIDNRAQLEALASPFEACRLKDGSHLVITSRDEQIVIWAKAQKKLFMEGLNDAQANMLFNWHAFLRPENPPAEMKSLAKKVVEACKGLPLALETLGAHLYDKNVAIWEAIVKVLEDRHGPLAPAQSEVTSILKISYDGLRSEEKIMFLDIACFMLGVNKGRAKRILCESGASVLGLETLKLKSLVKFDRYRGHLTMHDLLRDMGREIVERSHPNIWQRSHIWNMTDARDVLRQRKGASEVRAAQLNLGYRGEQWSTEYFAGMNSLRFLRLSGKANITGDFGMFPQELRWLEWFGCRWKSFPRKLDLSKVAVLDLWGSPISSLSCNGHMFENLRELELTNGWLKELPDFRVCCKKLEVLNLRGCRNLKRVPESIGCLSSTLTRLNLGFCEKLTTLPDALGHLHCLKSLELHGCTSLTRLPASIGCLSSTMTRLNLSCCEKLTTLPDALGHLHCLKSLELDGCTSLTRLPASIGCLSSTLTRLDLRRCEKLTTLPDALGHLHCLMSLELYCCSSLTRLPDAIGQLTALKVLGLESLRSLVILPQSLGGLAKLSELDLSSCERLQKLPSTVGNLRKLSSLRMSGSGIREIPAAVGCLTNLVYLVASDCEAMVSIPEEIGKLCNLKFLNLRGCERLSHLPSSIGTLRDLVKLDISRCNIGEGGLPKELRGLSSLRILSLSENPLSRLPEDLHLLTGLQTLHVGSLREVPYTSCCKNLREGNLTFPPSLKRWYTDKCRRLMRLPRDGLAHLEQLDAIGCMGLRSSDAVEEFAGRTSSLRRLSLGGTGISLGPWIEKLVSLEDLILDGGSFPECFIRYNLQEVQVHNPIVVKREVWLLEVTVPHDGMDCTGFVVCAASQSFKYDLLLRKRGPEEGHERSCIESFFLQEHQLRVKMFRFAEIPMLYDFDVEGGSIFSVGLQYSYSGMSSNNGAAEAGRPVHAHHELKAAARLVHADHEFKEIMAKLALAGGEGGPSGS